MATASLTPGTLTGRWRSVMSLWPSSPSCPGPQHDTVPSPCSTQVWNLPPVLSPMLTVKTSSSTAALSRSRVPSSPQHVTPLSGSTAHVRRNEDATRVSPLRAPPPAVNPSKRGSVTVTDELTSHRPTPAPAGKKRRSGSDRSSHRPPARRCCKPNSIRPSARRRAVMRTHMRAAGSSGASRSAIGALHNQRPVAAPTGNNRLFGRMRSSRRSSASCRRSANSVRPSSRRCASMCIRCPRSSLSDADSCASAGDEVALTTSTVTSTATTTSADPAFKIRLCMVLSRAVMTPFR